MTPRAGALRPIPLPLPERARRTLPEPKPATLHAVGNPALLAGPLLGLLASRDCPGRILLDTLELVPPWLRDGRVILSGFHSPLEQQVLRSVLRRNGCVVKILARGMQEYHPPEAERAPLTNGTLLVVTAYPVRTGASPRWPGKCRRGRGPLRNSQELPIRTEQASDDKQNSEHP